MSEEMVREIRKSFDLIISALREGMDISGPLDSAKASLRCLRESYQGEPQKTERFIVSLVFDALMYTPVRNLSEDGIRFLDSIIRALGDGEMDDADFGEAYTKILQSGFSSFPEVSD